MGQFEALMKRTSAVKMTPIYLPLGDGDRPTVIFGKSNQWASAQGTWITEGEEVGFPGYVTDFQCLRQEGLCFRTDLRLSVGLTLSPSVIVGTIARAGSFQPYVSA